MDGFVSAFIAALLAVATDRPPWLAAILADRYRRPFLQLLAIALANAALGAAAVLGAMYVAPILNPAARSLLLGLSLVAAAAGTAWPVKAPADRLANWRIGSFATTLLGIFILAFGDRTQFVVFGSAVAGSSAVLAGCGGVLGATAACLPGLMLGEARWRRLPWRRIRWTSAILLGLAGIAALVSGLRLI